MPANLENSAVATGLEKVSFHFNPKERQCQRMFKLPHNYTHLTQHCIPFLCYHFNVILKSERSWYIIFMRVIVYQAEQTAV